MAKKDFTQVMTDPVYNAIANATADEPELNQAENMDDDEVMAEIDEPVKKSRKPRRSDTEEEKYQAMMAMKTVGHKGAKLPRINLAFRPDVYEFVTTMARVQGITLTQFVNDALIYYLNQNKEIYDKAIEFRKMLEKNTEQ